MRYIIAEMFLKGRKSRKYARNTYFERLSPSTIGVRLHKTHIVVIHEDNSITLNTGGWETITTRDRMNRVLSDLFQYTEHKAPRVGTTKNIMFLREPMRQWVEYFDGMILDAKGRCINYWNRG